MHDPSVSLWDLRTIPLWSKWTKDLTLYCLNKIKEIMILILQNFRKPIRQTILLIGIIWWAQFQSYMFQIILEYMYILKKTCQNFNSNFNSQEFQLQFQLQLREFQLQLQLRQISWISTPTPGVSTPTPTPTPANLQNINSNSNSGGFNSNYASPVYGVATICHQVRWLRWGHPSLFHIATSLLIWYKMFCVRDISYRLIWMEHIHMFSVYAQSGTHSRFNW